MKEIEKLLIAFVGKTLKIPAEEATSLLFDKNDEGEVTVKSKALETLLDKDSERIKVLKDEKQEFFDNGYKKAQKEVLSDLEKEVKSEFDLSSSKQGLELIKELVSKKLESTGELDDDKIKASPLYLKTLEDHKKNLKQVESEWKTKYEEREKTLEKQKTFDVVKQKIHDKISKLEPILPNDPTKAQRQWDLFYKSLGEFEFKIVDGEVSMFKDGKLLEDKHGHKINFETFAEDLAPWDFKSGTNRSSAGNDNDGGGNKGKGTTTHAGKVNYTKDADGKITVTDKINTEQDYLKAIENADTPELRIAITDAFESANSNQE